MNKKQKNMIVAALLAGALIMGITLGVVKYKESQVVHPEEDLEVETPVEGEGDEVETPVEGEEESGVVEIPEDNLDEFIMNDAVYEKETLSFVYEIENKTESAIEYGNDFVVQDGDILNGGMAYMNNMNSGENTLEPGAKATEKLSIDFLTEELKANSDYMLTKEYLGKDGTNYNIHIHFETDDNKEIINITQNMEHYNLDEVQTEEDIKLETDTKDVEKPAK